MRHSLEDCPKDYLPPYRSLESDDVLRIIHINGICMCEVRQNLHSLDYQHLGSKVNHTRFGMSILPSLSCYSSLIRLLLPPHFRYQIYMPLPSTLSAILVCSSAL